jgi:D-beta-D-heptose 7-phosphate kinase/D-beta-D-heptose 1-phosphate adenosyltransferase
MGDPLMSAISPAQTRQLLKKIAGLRVLVVGDVMLDHYIWGDATRISPEAPVPVVNRDRETDTAGGAANVAANAASLGAAVELAGAIGRDANGGRLLTHLASRNIRFDPGFLQDCATITKTRVVVRNQQLCRIDAEDTPARYRATFASEKAFRCLQHKIAKCHAVILSDYAKGLLTTELVGKITATVRKHHGFVSLDPKPAGGNDSDGLDLITPNHKEALEMTGLKPDQDGLDDALVCRRIWEQYHPRNLVVTLGADGMLLSRQGVPGRRIPTAAREVFDVSGAGDTVIAALTLALVAGADLETAAHFANAAAGVVVGKIGTATLSPDELVAYVSHSS